MEAFEFLPEFRQASLDDYAATLPPRPAGGGAALDLRVARQLAAHFAEGKPVRGLAPAPGSAHGGSEAGDLPLAGAPAEALLVSMPPSAAEGLAGSCGEAPDESGGGNGLGGLGGVYRASASGRRECGAPVYERMSLRPRPRRWPRQPLGSGGGVEDAQEDAEAAEDLQPQPIIVRRADVSRKTGQRRHGWLLLSPAGVALWGMRTEALAVPGAGWKRFGTAGASAAAPSALASASAPSACSASSAASSSSPGPGAGELRVLPRARLEEALLEEAARRGALGVAAAASEDLPAALAASEAGLLALDLSALRFGERFEAVASSLLVLRATAELKLGRSRESLRDAVAALGLLRWGGAAAARGGGEEAVARSAAEAALLQMGFQDEALKRVCKPLLAAGIGALDLGAPLALGGVERWIDREVLPTVPTAAVAPVQPQAAAS